jgi:phosphate starvation-inducible membrane PsiE
MFHQSHANVFFLYDRTVAKVTGVLRSQVSSLYETSEYWWIYYMYISHSALTFIEVVEDMNSSWHINCIWNDNLKGVAKYNFD